MCQRHKLTVLQTSWLSAHRHCHTEKLHAQQHDRDCRMTAITTPVEAQLLLTSHLPRILSCVSGTGTPCAATSSWESEWCAG